MVTIIENSANAFEVIPVLEYQHEISNVELDLEIFTREYRTYRQAYRATVEGGFTINNAD
mgnify:CR=1 FL=1|tara:strand:- start:1855 stop:2034 length:180 start_codon:yes stop_codon:yes gene_type:complete